ncbi:putative E3 ubiquitin-protein ligase [Spiromyces aspiralis]|uniref:E3 ubiquitin-protein ligase n=1 Tax=Spiromyces aspiralis TaxID=68401 RepID=A0ACC1HVT7_9FUNG|nr:putative E3 ubiquitin-protein ligase [Spiromyces aspiralis]
MAALFLSSFRQLGNRKGRANSTATGTTNNTNDPGCSSSGSGGSIAATGGASNSIGSDVQQMRPTPKSGNSSSLLSRSRSRTNHSRPSAKSKADSRRRRRRTKDEPFDDSDESGGEIWLDPRIPIRDQLDKLQAYHSRKNQTSVNGTAAAATTNKPSGAPPQVTDDPFLHDFASRIAAETINGGKSGADRLGRANSVSRKRGDSGEDSMLGICICCSTQLRYPVNQQCFKCSVCETINDLVPWSPFGAGGGTDAKPEDGQKRPPPLTLSRLNEGIDEYRQRPEKLSLLEVMVRESFSYAEVLNRSFMCGEVGAESPGLDWVELREAYRTLLGLPVSIIRAMMNGIEASLRRPGRPMRHKEDIRFLVIILENPLLLQNEFPQEAHYHHQILKRVLGFIGNLPYRLHCTLVSWFLGAPSSSFQSKIQMANQFISYRLTRHYYSAQKGDRLSPQNSRIQQPSDAGGAGGSIGTDISGRGNGRTRSITMAVPTSPTVDNSLQQQSPVGSALHEQRPSRSSGLAPPALTTRDTHDNNGAAGASSIARVYIVEPEPLSPQFSKELAARRRNRSRAHANTVIIGESMNKKNHQPPAVEQTQSVSLSPSASFRSKRAAGSGEATKFPNLVGDSAATATATEPSAIRDTMYQPADGVGDSASALAGDPSATSQLLASGQSITTTLRGTKSVRRILGTRQYSPPDVTSPRSREAFEEEQRIAFGIIDDDHGFGEFSNVAPSRQTPLPSSLQSRPGALSTLEAGNMGLGPVPPALKSPASVARAPWLASGAGSGASGSTTDSVAQNGADSSLHLGTGSTAATPIIPSSRPILNLDPRGSPVNMESMISDIFNRHYSVSVPSLQDGDNAAKSSPEEKNTTFNASLLSPAAFYGERLILYRSVRVPLAALSQP